MTLAGLVKRLAGVEDYWFGEVLRREPEDEPWVSALRWILVHQVEEYARHCGHADPIRESIDGTTGD